VLCLIFLLSFVGCKTPEKVVTPKPDTISKFNDEGLKGISLDAMEPSPHVWMSRDTIFIPAETDTIRKISEKQADAFILALQQQKIDTICTLIQDCVGCAQIFDLKTVCKDIEYETYIFWKQNGKTYFTKRDNCHDYNIIALKDDDFWNSYFNNESTIASEKLKRPEYIFKDNSGNHKYSISISHYRFDQIKLYIQNNLIHLSKLPDYYFERKIKSNKHENINYKYNTNTFNNQLRIKLTSIIKESKKDLKQ